MNHPDIDIILSAYAVCRRPRRGWVPHPEERRLAERVEPIFASVLRAHGTIDVHEAEDIVQLVWTKLTENNWRRLLEFDPQKASLESYVRMVTRQVLAEVGRTKKANINSVELEPDSTHLRFEEGLAPEARAADRDLVDKLLATLERKLTPRAWSIFLYKYRDELPDKQIAGRLGANVQCVYNAHFVARRIAKEALASEFVD